MQAKTATEDIYIPNPEFPGARILVCRKGQIVPRRYLDLVEVGAIVENPAAEVEDAGPNYEGMTVPDLKDLLNERGLHAEGTKKADLIDALEAADEAAEGDGEPAGGQVVNSGSLSGTPAE